MIGGVGTSGTLARKSTGFAGVDPRRYRAGRMYLNDSHGLLTFAHPLDILTFEPKFPCKLKSPLLFIATMHFHLKRIQCRLTYTNKPLTFSIDSFYQPLAAWS